MGWWLFSASLLVVILLVLKIKTDGESRVHELHFERERVLTAQKFYLEALRRELAQLIKGVSLETFERAFYKMHEVEQEFKRSDSSRCKAEKALLFKKFPTMENFDLIGTRHFVSYESAKRNNHIDELVERYREISTFLILEDEVSSRAISYEDERRIFEECIQDEKNKRLRYAIDEAMLRYGIRRGNGTEIGKQEEYRDGDYEVTSLIGVPGREFTPEIEYGIFCKKFNEYGVYSFFVHSEDDDETKVYHSYYRSDGLFEKKSHIGSGR